MTKLTDAFQDLEHALNPNLARALTAPEPDTIDAHLTHVVTYLRILTRHVEMLARSHAGLILEHHPNLAKFPDTHTQTSPRVDVIIPNQEPKP